MSWNIAFGVVARTTIDRLGELGHPSTGRTSTLEEASSLDSAAFAALQVGPDVLLIDAMLADVTLAAPAAAEAFDTESFVLMLGGTADTYAFEVYGPHQRQLVISEGEVVESTGAVHPIERDGDQASLADATDYEDAWLDVVSRLTGRTIGDLVSAEVTVLESAVS
ncbi:MAG: hypothetical protein ACTH2Q_16300 [Propionibacteriaceae bacterium]